eukprot:4644869-Pyramimonas_sp.AAC.1
MAFPSEQVGALGGCADDVGAVAMTIQSAKHMHRTFEQAEQLASLELQPSKCCFVPLWAPCDEPTICRAREALAAVAPGWANF